MAAAKKNLIFDWNSTLLDDFPIVHQTLNHILHSAGRAPVTIEQFRASYDIPFEQLYVNLGFTPDEARHMIDVERDMFHDYYEPAAAAAPLRDGAVDILSHARERGIGSYILSNHIVDPIKVHLSRLKIDHMFDEVLAYATRETQFRDMTKGERLRQYRETNRIAAEDTIIIGDSVEEIDIGHEQNLISVAITGGGAEEARLRAQKPDYVIHSLHELKPILKEQGFVS
jgi:phosphoglycolate phosphatase-like HAD superfamily hydrolase